MQQVGLFNTSSQKIFVETRANYDSIISSPGNLYTLYIDESTNAIYRFNGTSYVEISRTQLFGYQDFAAGVITGTEITIDDNENGTSAPFLIDDIFPQASIVSSTNPEQNVYTAGTGGFFEKLVSVDSVVKNANSLTITLNRIPNPATPIRIYYPYFGAKPENYNIPPQNVIDAHAILVLDGQVLTPESIGTDVQGYSDILQSISDLSPLSSGKILTSTAIDTLSSFSLGDYARDTIFPVASEAAFKAAVNLEIGVDVQAFDLDLQALADLATTGILVRTGSGTVATRTLQFDANHLSITRPNGVSGDPVLTLANAITLGSALIPASFTMYGNMSLLASGASNGDLSLAGSITVGGTVDGVDIAALSSTVATNTSNIATNTSNIATNASNISSIQSDLNGFPDELKNLTTLEIQQLENIGLTTLDAIHWSRLGSMNQTVSTTSSVVFAHDSQITDVVNFDFSGAQSILTAIDASLSDKDLMLIAKGTGGVYAKGTSLGVIDTLGNQYFSLSENGDGTGNFELDGSLVQTNSSKVSYFTGNLGVGGSPDAQLDIKSSGASETGVIIDNTSTGDSVLRFQLGSSTKAMIGVDNSDSDKFKITYGTTLGATNDLVIDGSSVSSNTPFIATSDAASTNLIKANSSTNHIGLMPRSGVLVGKVSYTRSAIVGQGVNGVERVVMDWDVWNGGGGEDDMKNVRIYSQGTEMFRVNASGVNINGKLAVGLTATSNSQAHIKQASTTGAIVCQKLEQSDIDFAFMDFVGTSAADSSRSLSSSTATAGAKTGAIRIKINGTDGWLRVYDSAV